MSPRCSFAFLSDSQKKVHQGWGGDEGTTELKTEQDAAADAAAEPAAGGWATEPAAGEWAADSAVPAGDWDTPVEGDAAVPAGEGEAKPEGKPRREREDEEDNTLTLEQYFAQKKDKDVVVPKIEAVRQANEGAGDDLWKDAVALSKNSDEEAYFVGKVRPYLFLFSWPHPRSAKICSQGQGQEGREGLPRDRCPL